MMKSIQEQLRSFVIEAIRCQGGVASLAEINKTVWQKHLQEIHFMGEDVLWTWQHLIASSRKTLVDNKEISRSVVKGVTYYSLAH